MRSYRTQQEVPWKDVLHILRWFLKIKLRDVRNHRMRGDAFAEAMDLQSVRMGYEALKNLRCFLRYGKKTKLEQEAELLMEYMPENQQLQIRPKQVK